MNGKERLFGGEIETIVSLIVQPEHAPNDGLAYQVRRKTYMARDAWLAVAKSQDKTAFNFLRDCESFLKTEKEPVNIWQEQLWQGCKVMAYFRLTGCTDVLEVQQIDHN